MTEEERAALHRAQSEARCQSRRERLLALRGDSDARDDVIAGWQPPVLARLERQLPAEPAEDCERCLDPYPACELLP